MDIGNISRGMSIGSTAGLKNIGFKLKALFAHLFTNKTTTIDGTRYLVNQGKGENAVMHTGQGAYFNGVDNYINTGSRATDKCTFILTFNMATGSNDFIAGGSFANSIRVQPDSNKILFRLGNSDYAEFTPSKSIAFNEDITVCLSYEHINGVSQFTLIIDDEVLTNVQNNNPSSYEPFVIASRAGITYWAGVISSFYLLPDFVPTLGQFQDHYNNPEQTLYWDNGVLKSDILDQATIDSMQSGNGFWYPLTENVSAVGYYRNHALPIPSNLVDGNFDVVQSDWTDNLDGSYTSTGGTGPLNQNLQEPNLLTELSSYILEVEVFGGSAGQLGYYNGSVNIDFTAGDGYKRILATTSAGRTMLALNCSSGFIGSIRNIKIYPLENSGLTPLVNWTSTSTTNAQQLTTGYQCALQELDSFGLPIAKPDGLLHGDGRGAVDFNGWRLTNESFELDFLYDFTKSIGEWVTIIANGTGNTADDFRITQRGFDTTARGLFIIGGTYDFVGASQGLNVYTVVVDRDNGLSNIYENGVLRATNSSVAHGNFTLNDVFIILSDKSDVGNYQITEGTRTDEQRTADVTKLMTKYGVV